LRLRVADLLSVTGARIIDAALPMQNERI